MKKIILLAVVVMILFCNTVTVSAANQTPYTEQMAQGDYLCGATFILEKPANYAKWLEQELTQAKEEYHLNTITVYGLENYDDAYKTALFNQLKKLDMKICVRIEGYDSTFAFTREDAAAVMSRYKELVEFTCQPQYRDTVYYYALNMPVDDPAVQENLGGVNSWRSKTNQVSYAKEIVRLMRQCTAENGYADAKLYLSVFYGWDGTYDVPSYASAGADGYFINNYTYPASDTLTGADGDPKDILNTPRLSRIMGMFLEDYPHKPPLVVESGFHTLEYNNGQWPAQTAGLVLDRETKAIAMKELVEFYEREYPFVEGLLYFGYNLFKEEGNPPAVMDWALKYPTEDKSQGTTVPGSKGINLMDNPGFEQDKQWFPCWGHSASVTPNTNANFTHSGAVSAKVAAGHKGEAYAYCNTSATYNLDAAFSTGMWVYLAKAEDARYVTLYLERPGSAGGTVTAKPEGKTGWQKVTIEGTETQGTARQAIKFVVEEGNSGDIYFDDAFLYCRDAESVNLIRNSSFDRDKNTWEDDTVFEILPDVAHSGKGSAKLTGEKNIYQASGWHPNRTSVDSGETLYYSAWVKGGENAGSITLRAEVKCGPTINYYSGNVTGQTDGWKLLTVEIPYPDLTVNEILFHITTTGSGVFYADDVAVNSVEPAKAIWQGHSMALGDDLDMRFYVAVQEGKEESVSVKLNNQVYTTADAVKDAETGNYIFSIHLAAAQMTDAVTAELWAEGKCLHSGSYTIKDHAQKILAETQDEKLINLLRGMLNYGGKAQSYFAYNEENPADAGIALTDVPVPGTADYECQVQGSLDGIRFYGATLLFQSRTVIRYYFTADNAVADYFVKVDGAAANWQEKDGMYYVEATVENPAALSKIHTVTVQNGAGDAMTVAYGGMHYITRMAEKGDSKVQALVKALYGYHLAASEWNKN